MLNRGTTTYVHTEQPTLTRGAMKKYDKKITHKLTCHTAKSAWKVSSEAEQRFAPNESGKLADCRGDDAWGARKQSNGKQNRTERSIDDAVSSVLFF